MLKAISTITNALGALNYKGTWNASSNTPTLADGTGAKGDYYVTSTAGTQTFGGLQLFFGIGDWIVYNGAVWQRVEGGSDGNFANVTMTSTDAGAAAAPLLDLYRDSATPAASDTLGEIEFNGEDSAGNKQQYAVIHASILSPTSTAESGQIHFETATAGASTEKMIIGTSNLVINDIGGIFNVRIEGDTDANLFFTDATNSRVGVGTITPAFKLDVNGTLGVTGVATLGNGAVLGTPASGSVTNLTGTASININGTVGATTPNTGSFSALTAPTSAAGNVHSGSYTPTLTNVANCSSSTANPFYYMRVGNVVTVCGNIATTITTPATQLILEFTVPIATTFSVLGQCAGMGVPIASADVLAVYWYTGSTAALRGVPITTGAVNYSVQFTYVIL